MLLNMIYLVTLEKAEVNDRLDKHLRVHFTKTVIILELVFPRTGQIMIELLTLDLSTSVLRTFRRSPCDLFSLFFHVGCREIAVVQWQLGSTLKHAK